MDGKRLIVAAAFVGLAFLSMTGSANAAALSATHQTLAGESNLVQQANYIFEGREYCWYPGGWRGPGYYWCGYAWRRGYGWGGGYGWNGWGRGGPGPYRGAYFYGGGRGYGYGRGHR